VILYLLRVVASIQGRAGNVADGGATVAMNASDLTGRRVAPNSPTDRLDSHPAAAAAEICAQYNSINVSGFGAGRRAYDGAGIAVAQARS